MPSAPSQQLREDIALRLSAQRALLGAVTQNLRHVSCDISGGDIAVLFVFDGPISEQDRDAASIACAEIISDFPGTISEECVRVDAPAPYRDKALRYWVFQRME
jgi:hypothetical protein